MMENLLRFRRATPERQRQVCVALATAFVLADDEAAWLELVEAVGIPLAAPFELARQVRQSPTETRQYLAEISVLACLSNRNDRPGLQCLTAYRRALAVADMRTHPVWDELG
ncbi:hypothetical protein D477_002638 [Arthrobacter crystallopoietes BAB-32]|uniref:Uncharacterized protein n=1 Tax=Arthrobacter crystallopoietes BAB-32 TaxID=1246476 RepID=N1V6X9_9MICC|nr:hypothetical protein [Arthrobacter crystallopoietes]EMY35754.1 hypothetical protein D477_002638 [Arthrobacter crystallopoietes BAB-32]